LASIVMFRLLHVALGHPASVLAGSAATPHAVAAICYQLGLDQSPATQYLHWLGDVVVGHLGMSYTIHEPIATLIGQRIATTPPLTIAASALAADRLLRDPVSSVTAVHCHPWRLVCSALERAAERWVSVAVPGTGRRDRAVGVANRRDSVADVPVVARLLATEMRRIGALEFVLTAVAKGANQLLRLEATCDPS
jgi:hypothetical protein